MAQIRNSSRLEIYKCCMVEIKERTLEIDTLLSPWRREGASNMRTCEAISLQLRKIYELVGFASMSADLDRYREIKSSFEKEWRFAEILKRLSTLNPEFLPKPVRRVRATEQGVDWHIEERPEAILTHKELVFRHGYLSTFLHAKNPFSNEVNCSDACRKFDTWVREITSLLARHRYVVGPHQEGFIVELNGHGADVTAFEYARRD